MRDPKGAREDAQAAAFLIGMQNLLAMSFGIGIGGRVFTATTPKAMTAIFLFALLFWLDCSILSTWQRFMYLITGKQEADQNFSVKSQAETLISMRWSSEGYLAWRKQLR